MVEHITTHLREVSRKARPQGQDALGAERVKVDDSAQGDMATQICQSGTYTDYSDKVKNFCLDQLGGPNHRVILRAWEGQQLEAKGVPSSKAKVCTKMLRVCPAQKPGRDITKCQACMEAFQTLDFLVRRDSTQIQLASAVMDPMAIGKKKKKQVDDGFASPLHIEMRMEELCGELHLHFTGAALESIEEMCDEVTSDLAPEVKRAFSVLGRGADFGHPVYGVCVNAAEMCSQKEFDALFPYMHNFHANVTNVIPDHRPDREL